MKKIKLETRITGYDGGLSAVIIDPKCANLKCRSRSLLRIMGTDSFKCAKCKKETIILLKAEAILKK